MTVAECGAMDWKVTQDVPVSVAGKRPLHRLKVVRRRQRLSCRKMAARMNVTSEQVRQQECETADLPLSVLYAWQKAMDVPIAELLVETGDTLVSSVLERSQLVRLMKTVLAIFEQAKQQSIQRMAQTMRDQLVEIMPELVEVSPWRAVGERRRLNELGVAAQRCLAEDVFLDRSQWSVE